VREFISKILGNKETVEKNAKPSQPDGQLTLVQKTIDPADEGNGNENGNELRPDELPAADPIDESAPGVTAVTQVADEEIMAMHDTAVERDVLTDTAETKLENIPSELSHALGLRAVQSCHIGNVRSRNEDSSYIFTAESGGQEPLIPFGLYIVADGMGGHHDGHEASKGVSTLVAQNVLERIYLPLLKNRTDDNGQPPEPVSEVILDAVQLANQHIHSPEPGKDSGTTLTAALVFGRRLYVVHVGDSRAYLLVGGELKQITVDHSYVRRLIDAGQITEEEAAVHPQRNMLYRAVGQGGDLDIDTFTQSLPRNGKLFICSDGLWGLIPGPVISDVLQQDVPLNVMTETLVQLALEAGGHDNITGVLVEFGF